MDWHKAVRAVVAKLPEPFVVYDVYAALGISTADEKDCARAALFRIADAGELTKEEKPGGEARNRRWQWQFTRTVNFRAEDFDPEAQRIAARLIQDVALRWTQRRTREHAAE
jgi:hypothetical protein